VGVRVGNVKNNDPGLIEPIAAEQADTPADEDARRWPLQ